MEKRMLHRDQTHETLIDTRRKFSGAEATCTHGTLDPGTLFALQKRRIAVYRRQNPGIVGKPIHLFPNTEQSCDGGRIIFGGLSQITEIWGYHGAYAQEPSEQI